MDSSSGNRPGASHSGPLLDSPTIPAESPPQELRSATLRGSIWTLSGYATAQLFRFCSSVVLTRLLEPAVYGTSAILTAVMVALTMFTDVGLSASIVQNPRGTDPIFLRTAWTVQVIRGLMLFFAAAALGWPVAVFYSQPELVILLPVVGLNSLVSGFSSVNLLIMSRRLRLGRITALEIGTQTLSIGVTILYASLSPTVWAFVTGTLVGVTAKSVLSHLVVPGPRAAFAWDPASRRQLLAFGKWIFLATAFSFVSLQGDRVVLSMFVSLSSLGVYALAVQLGQVGTSVVSALSGKVLFPLYSRLIERGVEAVRPRLLRIRLILLAAALPIPVLFATNGDILVKIVFGASFSEAGWMLQLISAGAVFQVIELTISPLILARGHSFRHMVVVVARGLLMIGLMMVGARLAGIAGLVVGVGLSHLCAYPVLIWAIRDSKTWMPLLDAASLVYCLILGAASWFGRPLVQMAAGSILIALKQWL